MASLTDLFNPTFLMFLGILVLVVALVVVYFESKLREQNHKISSMFSIISTLAEDVTGMKMGVNQLMNFNNATGGSVQENFIQQKPFVPYEQNTKLIEVSDDEESEAEDINSEVEDAEEDSESDVEDVEDDSSLGKYMDDMESEPDSLSESDLEDVDQEKITVFKLKEDVDENIENVEEESIDELASELSDGDLGDIENIENVEEAVKEEPILNVSELKTISINLEEPVEKIDYKKLQLPKLKSIIVEKGLATSSDASKMKKAELLKLLEIE